MNDDRKVRMNSDLLISIVLRGAIAVSIGVAAAMLVFARLTNATLMVSYKQAEVSLERTPVALMPEMAYSLVIGISVGVIALVAIFTLWVRSGKGKG